MLISFILIIFTSSTANIYLDVNNYTNLDYTTVTDSHTPIYIGGNEALATFIVDEGLSGKGTIISPYVIENFVINAITTHGIVINSTDVYLIIKNCTIVGPGIGHDNLFVGIFLQNTEKVIVSNNNVSVFFNGIRLEESNNNTLSENIANSNRFGFYLIRSCTNVLFGNTANDNLEIGIKLSSLNINTLLSGNSINNNGDYGIYLEYSDNNILSGNSIKNNNLGIYLFYSDANIISGNIVTNNTHSWIGIEYSSKNILIRNCVNSEIMPFQTTTTTPGWSFNVIAVTLSVFLYFRKQRKEQS